MEVWAQVKIKAMENYELTEGSEQEGWGKLGPLSEPTPINAKNIGAAGRRRRQMDRGHDRDRSDEQGQGRKEGHGSGGGRREIANKGEGASEGRGEGSDESETEEVRRAMAKAIWEMEREEDETLQTTHNEEHAEQMAQARATSETKGIELMAEQQSQGPRKRQSTTAEASERQLEVNAPRTAMGAQFLQTTVPGISERQHVAEASTNDAAGSAMNEVNATDARTPLQELQDKLRQKFGQIILRPEGASNMARLSQEGG